MSFPGNLGLQCLTGLQFYLGTFLRKRVIQSIAFFKAPVNLMFDKTQHLYITYVMQLYARKRNFTLAHC